MTSEASGVDAPPFLELLRPELGELAAYLPHPGTYPVRLDANEAPPLLSAEARRALARPVEDLAWERYPDPTATRLRTAIAASMGVTPEHILVGAGSDEVISLLLTAASRPRGRGGIASVVTTTPTFVMYRLSARARGFRVLEVPLDADWDLPLASLAQALEMSEPNLVFVATPNNPTGNAVSRDRLVGLLRLPGPWLVVVDEAYVDYADASALDLLAEHPRLVLLRTLSKVGFASLRVGWACADPRLVRELDKVRQPYNLPVLSQRLACVVLEELGAERARLVQVVREERARLGAALRRLPGADVPESQANFLWVGTARPAAEVHARLAERGILVRSFHARGGRLTNRLRITIGTPEENDRLLAALSEVW